MADLLGTLQSCVSTAIWVYEKRKELKDNKDGCVDLCNTVGLLAEALRSMQSGPRPAIEAKALILSEIETVLVNCKAFVEDYLRRGLASRLAGAIFNSKDKSKLEGFKSRIKELLDIFSFVNTADTAKLAAATGKFDGIARAFWKDIKVAETLGRGATANVYGGSWKHNPVAIKTLNTFSNLADVKKELDAIHRLGTHPKIISLMAICEDLPSTEGRVAIIMELAHNGDLQGYLESRPPLRWTLLLRLAYDIADGMLYCHERGLIHRDLKTKNVCVDSNDRAKICDFGMSRFLEADRSAMTAGGLGTPQYAAIEVLDASLATHIRPACDVYSFGVILWEMVTRERPWIGLNSFQIGMNLKMGKTLPLPSHCDVAMQRLISSCLQNDQRQRPTFERVFNDLRDMRIVAENGGSATTAAIAAPPAAGSMFEPEWFYVDANNVPSAVGIGRAAIVQLYSTGKIGTQTSVWTSSLANWLSLNQSPLWDDCKSISPHRGSQLPPPPPPPPKYPEPPISPSAAESARRQCEEEERRMEETRERLEHLKMQKKRIALEQEERELRGEVESAAEAERLLQSKRQAEAEERRRRDAEAELALSREKLRRAQGLSTAEEIVSFVQTEASSASSAELVLVLLEKVKTVAGDVPGREKIAKFASMTFWTWIVSSIKYSNAAVGEKGCWAVNNLSFNNPVNTTKLGDVGACDAVVAALRAHVGNAAVGEYGCKAIRCLSWNKHALNRPKLLSLGAKDLAATVVNNSSFPENARQAGRDAISQLT